MLTQFATTTAKGSDAARSYISALRTALEARLGKEAALVEIDSTPSEEQAARIRDRLDAAAVVFGEVQAIEDVSLWTARVSFKPDMHTLSMQMLEGSIFDSELKLPWRERRLRAKYAEVAALTEGGVSLASLMDHPTTVRSIDRAALALGAIAVQQITARTFAAGYRPTYPIQLEHADPDLPGAINAILLGGSANVSLRNDKRDPLSVLQMLVQNVTTTAGLGTREVWEYVNHQAFVGVVEKWCPPRIAVSIVEQAVAAHPDSWVMWNNLAAQHLYNHDIDAAAEAAQRAHETGEPEVSALFLDATLAWNREDFKAAYEFYLRAPKGSRRNFGIAECLAKLGDPNQALPFYCKSIGAQPFRLDAVRVANLWVPKTRPGAVTCGFAVTSGAGSDAARIGPWRVSTVWSA